MFSVRQATTFLLLTAALSGCGMSPTASASQARVGLVGAAAADTDLGGGTGGLATRLKRLYGGVFDLYDANDDGVWKPADFELPEVRFLNLFHNEDADDDRVVTRAEFYTQAEHEDLLLYVEARASVTATTLHGRVSFDKVYEVLDVYLQPYLNKDDRKRFIKKAFVAADTDETGYLKTPELEVAYAILLAKAEEKRIEKSVNRSKGQPDAPIHIDPPGWVTKPTKS